MHPKPKLGPWHIYAYRFPTTQAESLVSPSLKTPKPWLQWQTEYLDHLSYSVCVRSLPAPTHNDFRE